MRTGPRTYEPAWAALLCRGVAHLAAALPDDNPASTTDLPPPRYDYGLDAAEDDDAYQAWLVRYADRRDAERQQTRRQLARIGDAPTISVVEGDSVDVWNVAARKARGDFVAFVETGDQLEPGIIEDLALALHADPTIDVTYTDSDLVAEDGRRFRPFFKPDWSPDQLLSHPYIGRLLVVRRSLFEAVGRFAIEERGTAAEYDLSLKVTEQARRVFHLPIVGYHRRVPEPTVDEGDAILALDAALRRRSDPGGAEAGLCRGTYRIRRPVRGDPLVSVIVPFHNGAEHLRRCLRSLDESAGHRMWEAILVDNRSWDPNTRALLARYVSDDRIRVLSYPGPFNWAVINNFAVKHSNGAHLLFMNADVEGRSDGWMTAMLEHAQRPEVGAVGALLLYPNSSVQHAGVVMGLGGGVAWHAFCYCPAGKAGYFDQVRIIRNYSAVTGACMMVRYEVFQRVGGFAEDLPVAYNDVDFCLRLQDNGYRVVYSPYAELIHDESYARGRTPPDKYAVEAMVQRWGERIRSDPFYNSNLDLQRPQAALPGPRGGS